MGLAIFGSDTYLGKVLEAHYRASGRTVEAIRHDEISSVRRDGILVERVQGIGIDLCLVMAQLPKPVKNGPPIWLDTFTTNALIVENALTVSLPGLRAGTAPKFVLVADTPLRSFPEFDLKRGARTIETVRDSSVIACQSVAKRLVGEGIALSALHHPDLDIGVTRPTDLTDAQVADGVDTAIRSVTLETSGRILNICSIARAAGAP